MDSREYFFLITITGYVYDEDVVHTREESTTINRTVGIAGERGTMFFFTVN